MSILIQRPLQSGHLLLCLPGLKSRHRSRSTGIPFAVETFLPLAAAASIKHIRIEGNGQRFFVKLNEPKAWRCLMRKRQASRKFTIPARCVFPCRYAGGEIHRKHGWCWNIWRWAGLLQRRARSLGRDLPRCIVLLPEKFGWKRDNTIGATPQINTILLPTGFSSGVNIAWAIN